mmetsp:Transcript_20535/g.58187  ORF Transcript_20535/g.58187 Transcript_20535/m.58187 type:complete len:256 (-) Transcript_20535:464-1231(-)
MFAQRLTVARHLPSATTVHFSPGLDVVDALLAVLDDAEEPREAIHFVPGPQRGGRVEALRLEAGDRDCEPALRVFQESRLVSHALTRRIDDVDSAVHGAARPRKAPEPQPVVAEAGRVQIKAHQYLRDALVEAKHHLYPPRAPVALAVPPSGAGVSMNVIGVCPRHFHRADVKCDGVAAAPRRDVAVVRTLTHQVLVDAADDRERLRLVFHAVDEQINVRSRHRHVPDDVDDVLVGSVAALLIFGHGFVVVPLRL